MNDNIIYQVRGVFDRYYKDYSNDGVMANINAWSSHKICLINLFRNHPNWNEDELAVILPVNENREIIERNVQAAMGDLILLSDEMFDENGSIACNVRNSIRLACKGYCKTIVGENDIELIKRMSGINCVSGQKTSRVINAICKEFGIDKHEKYNAVFARLADTLNPLQIKRKAVISVHPCDYLEMSNKDNSWSSCHCLRDGQYQAGTLSYMNDHMSIMFYTVDDDVESDFYEHPKRCRQIFAYNNGVLLQSRLYPNPNDDKARDNYRNILQKVIADCLGAPNLWTLHREQELVNKYALTYHDSLHYPDYIYKEYKANISLLKSVESYDPLIIGHDAYCIECGDVVSDNEYLYCEDCGGGNCVCSECGDRISGDDVVWINDESYCRDCVSYCEHCDNYTLSDMTSVHDYYGREILVCDDCLDDFYRCDACDEFFHHNSIIPVNYGEERYCRDCIYEHGTCCDECDEYVACKDIEEVDGGHYCKDCAANLRTELENNGKDEVA